MINLQTKKQIRKEILAERRGLPEEKKQEYSHKITQNFIRSREFSEAETILCYVSAIEEVSTRELIEISWECGKKIGVPKVLGPHEMEFYEIQNWQQLQEGFKGILEPCGTKKLQEKKALVVLPGVAFDSFGKRIGYGGGFYDTYLQKHPEYTKAAFAFSIQMTEKIPAESHDVRVDSIYTEKGVYQIW